MDEPAFLALVVGNSVYEKAWTNLPTAGDDAGSMAKIFRKARGHVINDKYTNFDRTSFVTLLGHLKQQGVDRPKILYFSGHGFVYEDVEHLVMTDTPPPGGDKQLKAAAAASVSLETICRELTSVSEHPLFVIVDACRGNQAKNFNKKIAGFKDEDRIFEWSSGRACVIYSSQPGRKSYTKVVPESSKSFFTHYFAQFVARPFVSLQGAFRETREAMRKFAETSDQCEVPQSPRISQPIEEFSLFGGWKGYKWRDLYHLPKLAYIPGSPFYPGVKHSEQAYSDEPVAENKITLPGYGIGVTPVTNQDWELFSGRLDGDPLLPKVNVTINDAEDYCAWLSKQIGVAAAYRLPTEVEWMYAACGKMFADATPLPAYATGERIGIYDANFDTRYPAEGDAPASPIGEITHVNTYKPNGFGLQDVHGNVWELTQDNYDYDRYMLDGGKKTTKPFIAKGGSFRSDVSALRIAYRQPIDPSKRYWDVGFRVLRVLGHS